MMGTRPKERPCHRTHRHSIISARNLAQSVQFSGIKEGHAVSAIWDQVFWCLLCNAEAHVWKNPASYFSPLPVLNINEIQIFLCCFIWSILFMLCKMEQNLLSKNRISLGHNSKTVHVFCILQSDLTKARSLAISI